MSQSSQTSVSKKISYKVKVPKPQPEPIPQEEEKQAPEQVPEEISQALAAQRLKQSIMSFDDHDDMAFFKSKNVVPDKKTKLQWAIQAPLPVAQIKKKRGKLIKASQPAQMLPTVPNKSRPEPIASEAVRANSMGPVSAQPVVERSAFQSDSENEPEHTDVKKSIFVPTLSKNDEDMSEESSISQNAMSGVTVSEKDILDLHEQTHISSHINDPQAQQDVSKIPACMKTAFLPEIYNVGIFDRYEKKKSFSHHYKELINTMDVALKGNDLSMFFRSELDLTNVNFNTEAVNYFVELKPSDIIKPGVQQVLNRIRLSLNTNGVNDIKILIDAIKRWSNNDPAELWNIPQSILKGDYIVDLQTLWEKSKATKVHEDLVNKVRLYMDYYAPFCAALAVKKVFFQLFLDFTNANKQRRQKVSKRDRMFDLETTKYRQVLNLLVTFISQFMSHINTIGAKTLQELAEVGPVRLSKKITNEQGYAPITNKHFVKKAVGRKNTKKSGLFDSGIHQTSNVDQKDNGHWETTFCSKLTAFKSIEDVVTYANDITKNDPKAFKAAVKQTCSNIRPSDQAPEDYRRSKVNTFAWCVSLKNPSRHGYRAGPLIQPHFSRFSKKVVRAEKDLLDTTFVLKCQGLVASMPSLSENYCFVSHVFTNPEFDTAGLTDHLFIIQLKEGLVAEIQDLERVAGALLMFMVPDCNITLVPSRWNHRYDLPYRKANSLDVPFFQTALQNGHTEADIKDKATHSNVVTKVIYHQIIQMNKFSRQKLATVNRNFVRLQNTASSMSIANQFKGMHADLMPLSIGLVSSLPLDQPNYAEARVLNSIDKDLLRSQMIKIFHYTIDTTEGEVPPCMSTIVATLTASMQKAVKDEFASKLQQHLQTVVQSQFLDVKHDIYRHFHQGSTYDQDCFVRKVYKDAQFDIEHVLPEPEDIHICQDRACINGHKDNNRVEDSVVNEFFDCLFMEQYKNMKQKVVTYDIFAWLKRVTHDFLQNYCHRQTSFISNGHVQPQQKISLNSCEVQLRTVHVYSDLEPTFKSFKGQWDLYIRKLCLMDPVRVLHDGRAILRQTIQNLDKMQNAKMLNIQDLSSERQVLAFAMASFIASSLITSDQINTYGQNLLLTGISGGGKSIALEQFSELFKTCELNLDKNFVSEEVQFTGDQLCAFVMDELQQHHVVSDNYKRVLSWIESEHNLDVKNKPFVQFPAGAAKIMASSNASVTQMLSQVFQQAKKKFGNNVTPDNFCEEIKCNLMAISRKNILVDFKNTFSHPFGQVLRSGEKYDDITSYFKLILNIAMAIAQARVDACRLNDSPEYLKSSKYSLLLDEYRPHYPFQSGTNDNNAVQGYSMDCSKPDSVMFCIADSARNQCLTSPDILLSAIVSGCPKMSKLLADLDYKMRGWFYKTMHKVQDAIMNSGLTGLSDPSLRVPSIYERMVPESKTDAGKATQQETRLLAIATAEWEMISTNETTNMYSLVKDFINQVHTSIPLTPFVSQHQFSVVSPCVNIHQTAIVDSKCQKTFANINQQDAFAEHVPTSEHVQAAMDSGQPHIPLVVDGGFDPRLSLASRDVHKSDFHVTDFDQDVRPVSYSRLPQFGAGKSFKDYKDNYYSFCDQYRDSETVCLQSGQYNQQSLDHVWTPALVDYIVQLQKKPELNYDIQEIDEKVATKYSGCYLQSIEKYLSQIVGTTKIASQYAKSVCKAAYRTYLGDTHSLFGYVNDELGDNTDLKSNMFPPTTHIARHSALCLKDGWNPRDHDIIQQCFAFTAEQQRFSNILWEVGDKKDNRVLPQEKKGGVGKLSSDKIWKIDPKQVAELVEIILESFYTLLNSTLFDIVLRPFKTTLLKSYIDFKRDYSKFESYRSQYAGMRLFADIDALSNAELVMMFHRYFKQNTQTIKAFTSVDELVLLAIASAWQSHQQKYTESVLLNAISVVSSRIRTVALSYRVYAANLFSCNPYVLQHLNQEMSQFMDSMMKYTACDTTVKACFDQKIPKRDDAQANYLHDRYIDYFEQSCVQLLLHTPFSRLNTTFTQTARRSVKNLLHEIITAQADSMIALGGTSGTFLSTNKFSVDKYLVDHMRCLTGQSGVRLPEKHSNMLVSAALVGREIKATRRNVGGISLLTPFSYAYMFFENNDMSRVIFHMFKIAVYRQSMGLSNVEDAVRLGATHQTRSVHWDLDKKATAVGRDINFSNAQLTNMHPHRMEPGHLLQDTSANEAILSNIVMHLAGGIDQYLNENSDCKDVGSLKLADPSRYRALARLNQAIQQSINRGLGQSNQLNPRQPLFRHPNKELAQPQDKLKKKNEQIIRRALGDNALLSPASLSEQSESDHGTILQEQSSSIELSEGLMFIDTSAKRKRPQDLTMTHEVLVDGSQSMAQPQKRMRTSNMNDQTIQIPQHDLSFYNMLRPDNQIQQVQHAQMLSDEEEKNDPEVVGPQVPRQRRAESYNDSFLSDLPLHGRRDSIDSDADRN